VDDVSDGPKPGGPFEDIAPSPPERSRRRRPLVIGIIAGVLGTFVILTVIGYLVSPATIESEVPFEEDFSSDDPKFTLDSDRFVDFSVADGGYHILIKDASRPQNARHVFCAHVRWAQVRGNGNATRNRQHVVLGRLLVGRQRLPLRTAR
jgi:hypothetical protein